MQTQYVNEMLDIQELQIRQILPMSAEKLHNSGNSIFPNTMLPDLSIRLICDPKRK